MNTSYGQTQQPHQDPTKTGDAVPQRPDVASPQVSDHPQAAAQPQTADRRPQTADRDANSQDPSNPAAKPLRRSLGNLGELDAEVANKVKRSTGTDVGNLEVELRPDLATTGRRAVSEQGVGVGVASDEVLQDSMTLAHEAIHAVQQRGVSHENGKNEGAVLDAEAEAVKGARLVDPSCMRSRATNRRPRRR